MTDDDPVRQLGTQQAYNQLLPPGVVIVRACQVREVSALAASFFEIPSALDDLSATYLVQIVEQAYLYPYLQFSDEIQCDF